MSEIKINRNAFKYALSNFGEGSVFEEFAQSFLSKIVGDEFIPVGGTKDKGIDGSLRLFSRTTKPTFIYQISTELDVRGKVKDSIEKLIKNGITVSQFVYVTSRKVNDKNTLEDEFLEQSKIPLKIFDVEWFASNVVTDERLVLLYETYIESNIHEFQKPDKEYVVGNFIKDPRLYVFMRQQFNSSSSNIAIENKLADTLILYGLEGTASETRILRSSDEIKNQISQLVKFNPKQIGDTIDERLNVLSEKPRKINYHSPENAYCLPYPTRLILKERDIEEREIFSNFQKQTVAQLKNYLKDVEVKATKVLELIEQTIHKIYHKQGIEFSSFVIEGKSKDIIEVALPDIVGDVVDNSHIAVKNKTQVKKALLMTIRNMSYNGTIDQREYLRRLSQTYSMMFLLRWDPHLAASFQKIASQLKIYVGTSILIPALSEIFLEPKKRRYWNLLLGAHQSGVKIFINQTILNELVNHFGMIRHKYKTLFKPVEQVYLTDEMSTYYVDEIMIRAYLYSKRRGKVDSFNDFIQEFAHPSLNDAHRDLRNFLEEEFNIQYEDTSAIERKISTEDIQLLTEELSETKGSKERAHTDAKLMLMIYKMREVNDESESKTVFGYKTWWLSQDINTYKAVQTVFENRFSVNCYMRADFLYNYIALAPKKNEIDSMFKEVFPSMMGINLSFHMPKEICTHINKSIVQHKESSPTRIKRAIRNYTEKLMTTNTKNSKKLTSFFDEELEKILKKNN
jgi:uncharacterized protein (DUF2164 family)